MGGEFTYQLGNMVLALSGYYAQQINPDEAIEGRKDVRILDFAWDEDGQVKVPFEEPNRGRSKTWRHDRTRRQNLLLSF